MRLGIWRWRVRYFQAPEPRRGRGRCSHFSAGVWGDLVVVLRGDGGKEGLSPANSRSSLRAWPKLRPGSRYWTRWKQSPFAPLCGSHHPRPSWLTMRISPGPRRYLRAPRELSLASSRQGGGSRSSTAAQLVRARSSMTSGSYWVIGWVSGWDWKIRTVKTFSVCVCLARMSPAGREAGTGQGRRGFSRAGIFAVARRPAPCGVAGASGSHLRSPFFLLFDFRRRPERTSGLGFEQFWN